MEKALEWQVLFMLTHNRSVVEIMRETGLSNKTITRIAHENRVPIPRKRAVITDDIVERCKCMASNGMKRTQIAAELGIGKSTVDMIINGDREKRLKKDISDESLDYIGGALTETEQSDNMKLFADDEKEEFVKEEWYRFSLKLPMECKDYLQEMAWRNRITITELITRIIKADMEKHPEWRETIDVLNGGKS